MSGLKVRSFFYMPHTPKNSYIELFESFCKKTQIDGKDIEAKLGKHKLILKVASTAESQAKGYMHSKQPDEKSGMIFIYEKPASLSFWMKNVPFDLDIIFFNEVCEYIKHQTMKKYRGEPDHLLPRYDCGADARYAVEVCGGWFEKYGSPDCKLEF
jgi:uncharacterized membrane protein (UPF0127 family)